MKNLLLGIIAINLTFISIDTNAFEFKGVKSGMTQKEVEKIVRNNPRGLNKWAPNARIVSDGTGVIAHYTNEGKLWGLELYIQKYWDHLGRAANDGNKNALIEFCDEYTEILPDGSIAGAAGKYRCLLKDEVLYRESVEWFKRELLKHLK